MSIFAIAVGFSACTTSLQTQVSGNLDKLTPAQTVAILPVEVQSDRQMEMASMLRQNLHAHLKESNFNLLEHYIVDAQLKNNGLMDPADYYKLDPVTFGEILGVDAVLMTRINRLQKSYFLIHSSIEINVSVQMIDTRSGEILWQAEQIESDVEGIAKIPTGIAAALYAPISLVASQLKLNEITSKMVGKLTSIVKNPNEASGEKTFAEPKIASAWTHGEDETNPVQLTEGSALLKGNLQDQVPASVLEEKLVPVSKRVAAAKKSLPQATKPKTATATKTEKPSISF